MTVKEIHSQFGLVINPAEEYVAEETGEEIVLMKDKEGKVIGFEKLNFTAPSADGVRVAFETIAV